jgi:hypothetical protein
MQSGMFVLRGEQQTFEIIHSTRQLMEVGHILQLLSYFGCPGPWINERHAALAKYCWPMQYLETLYGEAARLAARQVGEVEVVGWKEHLAAEFGLQVRSYVSWVDLGFDPGLTRRDFKGRLLALRQRMIREGSGEFVHVDSRGQPYWHEWEDDKFQIEVRKVT